MAKLLVRRGEEKIITGSKIILQSKDNDIDFKLDNEDGYITLAAGTVLAVDTDIHIKTEANIANIVYFKLG